MIDLKDKKILQALTVNCRIPVSIIAKTIGLRPESVNERIRKLEEKGIIDNHHITVYGSAVGLIRYTNLFFKTKAGISKEILEQIKDIPEVVHLVRFEGAYNLGTVLMCTKAEHVKEVIARIENLLSDSLEFYAMALINRGSYLRRLYFIDRNDEEDFKHAKGVLFQKELLNIKRQPGGILALNNAELKILEILRHNAKISMRKISSLLRIHPDTVKSTIENLINRGIIWRFTIHINAEKLGFAKYELLINFKGEQNDAKNFLINHEKAVSFCEYSNLWSVKIVFVVKDNHEMKQILSQLNENFRENIKDYLLLEVAEQIKHSSFPENLSELYARAKTLFADHLN